VSSSGLFVLLFIVAIQAVPEGYKRYDNHKLVLLQVTEVDDYYFLEKQYQQNQSLDFWVEPRIGEVVVRLSPEDYDSFTVVLESRGIKYEKINDNIQEQMDETWGEIEKGSMDVFALNKYNTYAEILAWINNLPNEYSGANGLKIEPFTIGNSYGGRQQRAVKISHDSAGRKHTVMFDGGIHAREWISPATVCWMLNALLDDYTNDVEPIKTILQRVDIIVLPVFNPDGYAYTWTNDRLWRKTRSPNAGSSCVGTDPNRNWANHWGEQGTSTNPCAETYRGRVAASEIEVRQVQTFLTTNQETSSIQAYLNFHAYSQLWLSPYGYKSAPPPNNNELQSVGRAAAAALRAKFGTVYTVGPIYTTIYPASGSSADYGIENAYIPYSYAPELRPTSNSQYGFQLPASQIVDSGIETFEALKEVMQAVLGIPHN